MGLNRERITLNPLEESVNNVPLELAGDRYGHGIFIQPNGSSWPMADETPQLAQSVDTEGGLVAATTKGFKHPALKIQVIEPTDSAQTNYWINPQFANLLPGYVTSAANVIFTPILVRDLVGYDYALAIAVPIGGSNRSVQTEDFPAPMAAGIVTMGVWLKGANGGEVITLGLDELGSGTSTSTVTLTSSWQFYTVARTWSSGVQAQLVLTAAASATPTYFATGLCLVQGTLTEAFDGTFPGCTWTGAPYFSTSTRPASGGPRLNAIMRDLEGAVDNISRYHTGTVRRVTPNQAAANTRMTYDLVGATLNWDDESMKNAGVVYGTLTLLTEPYARGPEMTTITELWTPFLPNPNWMVTDAGVTTDWSGASNVLSYAGTSGTTEYRFLNTASSYTVPSGEVAAQFTPGTTTTGMKGGVIIRRVDSKNYMEAYVTDNGTNSILNLDEITSGARANRATATLSSRVATGTPFTIRGRVQNQGGQDNFYVEYFANTTNPPAATATPTNTLGPYNTSYAPFQTPGSAFLTGVVMVPQPNGVATFKVGEFTQAPYLARERTLPVLRFGVHGVPGSAPGLGRMVVQEDSGNDQYWLQWGIQHDRYSRLTNTNTPTDLFFEAEKLTPLNGASVITAAGFSGGKYVQLQPNVITGIPILSTTVVTGGFQLAHIGNFRVFARLGFYNVSGGQPTENINWSLQWSIGDLLTWTTNDAAVTNSMGAPSISATTCLQVVDLGMINIPAVTTGTQQWQGVIVGDANGFVGAETGFFIIDCLWFVPVDDGGAEVVGTHATGNPNTATPPSYQVIDNFAAGSASLNGLAPTWVQGGGTWATSGATTDFVENAGAKWITRSTTLDTGIGRLAVVGPSLTNQAAQVNFEWASGDFPYISGLLLRYNGTSGVIISAGAITTGIATFSGTTITVVNTGIGMTGGVNFLSGVTYTLFAYIDSDNRVYAYAGPANGTLTLCATASLTGVNASGQAGIIDRYSNGVTFARTYTAFQVFSPQSDAAIFGGKQLEIRSDRANRQSYANTSLWVPPSSYMGTYMKIPTPTYYDGINSVVVKTTRNDPTIGMINSNIDAVEAQVNVTPRYATQADE